MLQFTGRESQYCVSAVGGLRRDGASASACCITVFANFSVGESLIRRFVLLIISVTLLGGALAQAASYQTTNGSIVDPIMDWSTNSPHSYSGNNLGTDGYQGRANLTYANLDPTPLEQSESIDMMRFLEHGHKVRMVETDFNTYAVDTPGDLARVEEMMRDDELTQQYIGQRR